MRKEATKKKEEVQKEKDVKQESSKEKTLKYSEQFKGKQVNDANDTAITVDAGRKMEIVYC